MKGIVTLLITSLLTGVVYANGVGPVGPPGPQGPQGVAGPKGNNGTNGTNGTAGTNGSNGSNGATGAQGAQGGSADTSTDFSAGVGVRVFDTKYISGVIYDRYSVNIGHNTDVGGLITFKLGSSYEQREIAKLRKELKAESQNVLQLGD